MSYNGIKGSSLSLWPVCFSPSINSKSVESWGWRAWTNAGSPGPFEIGSAERRNHTDKLLAAISWERMKRGGTLAEDSTYWGTARAQGNQEQRSERMLIIGKREK